MVLSIDLCVHEPVYVHISEERLEDMIEVLAIARKGLPNERRMTREEALAHALRDPDSDPMGTWLVTVDGQVVAYGAAGVDSNRVRAGKNDGHLDVDVIPAFRGRGIEQELLQRGLEYFDLRGVATALFRCYTVDEWKRSLALSNGFSEFYRVYDMVRNGMDLPERPRLTDDISLERRLLTDCSDADLLRTAEAFNESFVDHINFAPEMPERFILWRNSSADPLLISLAKHDGRIVGLCISEISTTYNREHGANVGWINILGVVPEFRRRGLARALLADGISWVLEGGMDSVYIGVVSDNEKALGLYRSLGFRKVSEARWYRRQVPRNPIVTIG